jgi:hypothetical protein
MAAMPRALDHLVLPTASLDTARLRLKALGFTVAPDGVHPFGTANACVYFADGTFLEPLAIADAEAADAAAQGGNVFVARDRSYRADFGEEGFSALVFRTEDAEADHRAFEAQGMSAGETLRFSRAVTDARGKRDMAEFRLAFAAHDNAAGCFFFTCERVKAPAVDRSALERHENRGTGISRIVLRTAEPEGFAGFLAALVDQPVIGRSEAGLTIDTGNAGLLVADARQASGLIDLPLNPKAGLELCAIVFSVSEIGSVARLLGARRVAHGLEKNRLIVPPAAGQGAVFVFEAAA